MKIKTYIVLFIIVFLNISCFKDFQTQKTLKLLTKYKWEMINFVDYSNNTAPDFRKVEFYFEPKGVFYKIYENNDTVNSTYFLTEDGQLLIIGNNTYRITKITRNVLALRYGNLEIFFRRKNK